MVNDVIDIYEYDSTDSWFVPPTPTKLGLYPKYQPIKYIDTTYNFNTPVSVIQGHDGSLIKAFDDYRDDIILEFELRIFNNILLGKYDPVLNILTFLNNCLFIEILFYVKIYLIV